MTTELSEAQRELADNRAEIAELQGLIDGLEEKVRNGEAVEEAQQLGEQYGVLRVAQLRQEAVELKLKRAEAAELRERQEAAVQAAAEELEALSPERLADACEEALKVIERVHRLGDARQAAVVRHAKAFLELGMLDRVHHHAGPWVVFEVGGVRYDTNQDHLDGGALLAAVEGERHRRTLIPGRRAQGYADPEPSSHSMSQLLAKRLDAVQAAGGAE
ncbi:hypothetical protein GTY83_19160 [Streptomyces sp. SID4928]|uniref:hypothetical protein n=1 Tax=unclassified Streptomyces TaxID=2593676 RepID=UPI0001C1A571|nr:hypothetical protein [Streptomyces sp. ACT-1]EGE43192.1 hypothetical protein SACT1_3861 [Streptomyces sp. ACT-1]MYR51230.1 hypothetical protein [Streptomyces sp. SID4928]